MSILSFTGYPDNTDLGSVTYWSRLSGSSGDVIVNSDALVDFVTTNTTGAAYGVELGTADHSFEITFANTNPDGLFFPCAIRLTDANNFIGARWRLGTIQLWKRVSGTFTQISGDYALASISIGDKLKVVASGNSLSVYFNNTLIIGPATDSAHNTITKVGVVARSAANNNIISSAETTPNLPSTSTIAWLRI